MSGRLGDTPPLPLIRVGVLELRTNSDLVEPDLAEVLGAGVAGGVVVPGVGVEADAELEGAGVADGGGEVVLLEDLGAVEPELVEAGAVAAPARLHHDPVPRPRRHRRDLVEVLRLLRGGRAHVPVLDARAELVALWVANAGLAMTSVLKVFKVQVKY